MLVVTVDQVLDQHNKTRYWLSKRTDIYYPSLAKLCNNETTSIHFDTIEKICDALGCAPSDIIKIVK